VNPPRRTRLFSSSPVLLVFRQYAISPRLSPPFPLVFRLADPVPRFPALALGCDLLSSCWIPGFCQNPKPNSFLLVRNHSPHHSFLIGSSSFRLSTWSRKELLPLFARLFFFRLGFSTCFRPPVTNTFPPTFTPPNRPPKTPTKSDYFCNLIQLRNSADSL